jgi:DNA-binding response OmpR family regulator
MMVDVIEHTCMVITKKQNLLVIEKVLRAVGINRILNPNSFREVTELALQEMPHLFILESDLPDVSAMTILKKIKADPLFQAAQFVVIRKFTREEVMQCMEIKVPGMLQQPLDANALAQKLKAIIAGMKGLSPYRKDPEVLPGGKNTSIRVMGKISSTQDDFFTVDAGIIVPGGKQISLRPVDPNKTPVKVMSAGMADTDDTKAQRNILFSYESATGRGREWLIALKAERPAKTVQKRSVLLYEASVERGNQLKKMLAFYEIDITCVNSFEKLRLSHDSQKEKHRIVYLCEPTIHASGLGWDKYVSTLPPQDRPVQIIATTSQSPIKRPNTIWMKMPFGLDSLVEQFEAAFAYQSMQSSPAGMQTMDKSADVGLNMTFFGDLIAIDEHGALLDSPFEFPLNSRIHVIHPALAMIELNKNLRVSATRRLDAAGTKFRARVTVQEGNISIGRYWKPLSDKLDSVKVEVETEEAAGTANKFTGPGDAA